MDLVEFARLIADLGTAGGLIIVLLVWVRREQKQDEAESLRNQIQEERQSKEQDTYTSIITHQSEWLVHERERSDRLIRSEQEHRERMAELLGDISRDQAAHNEILTSMRDKTQQTADSVQSGFGLVDVALGEIKSTLEAINRNIDQLNVGIANHETNARQRYESRALTTARVTLLSNRYLDVLTAIRQQVDDVLTKLTTKEIPTVRTDGSTDNAPEDKTPDLPQDTTQDTTEDITPINPQDEKEITHETDN